MCKSSCGVCRLGASVRLGRCTSVSYVNQPDGCQTDHHRCNSIICDCCSLRLKQRQGHTSERAGSRLQSGATRRVLNNMVGGGLWSATFKVRAHGMGSRAAVCAHWEHATQTVPWRHNIASLSCVFALVRGDRVGCSGCALFWQAGSRSVPFHPPAPARRFAIWIPFGDHPLKLERYRED